MDHKFTASNAALSIDDAVMVDAISVEFSETQQKLPIYGYKSVVWDDILLGDYLIQGVFGINYSDSYSINQYLRGAGYESDEQFVPPVSGEYSVTADRRKFNLTITYMSSEFKKVLSEYDPVDDLQPGTFNKDRLHFVEETSKVANKYSEDVHNVTLKDAVITRLEQSIVSDDSPVIEFYSFVAREASNSRWIFAPK